MPKSTLCNGKPSLVRQYEEKKPEEEKREEFELDNNKGGKTTKTQDGEIVDTKIWDNYDLDIRV